MNKQIKPYVLLLALAVIPALAHAYVQMPTGSRLQPIPHSAHPNVSGNVNATAAPASSTTSTTTAPAPVQAKQEAPQQNVSGWDRYVLAVAILALVALGFWYFLFRVPE